MDYNADQVLDPFSAAILELDTLAGTQGGVNYAAEPVRWAREVGGVDLWSKQQAIVESIRDNRRTAVHSCHNVGKTFTAATAACWWIFSHKPGEAFVLSTAPTAVQVKNLLWREINRLHAKAGLPGRTNLTEMYLPTKNGEELVAFGRTTSAHNEAAFQGTHSRYVLVVLDEASGVDKAIWNAAESIASNEHSRVLALGNPDLPQGPFADACKPESPYNVIHIGYRDSPAVTGETVSELVLDSLISPEWVADRRQAWGEDSALFSAKCEGKFPTGDADPWRVIPETQAAECRFIEPPYDDNPVRVGGIDVGGGGDRTVLVERVNNAVGRIESFSSREPMETVGQLAHLVREWGLSRVRVDVIGIGWGVAGRLREVLDIPVEGVNFAARSNFPKKYLNLRAEVWWNGRTLTRDNLWSLANLDDDAVGELTMPRYEIVDSSGKIKIEPKDDVRERLGRSPDIADALLLAFFDGLSIPPVSDARSTFAAADLTSGGGFGTTVFGGSSIPGLPMSIPTSLERR